MVMNKLRLNKNIFSQSSISYAIDVFESLCVIIVSEDEKYFICSFDNCKYDVEKSKKEFENYLIDLINSNSII